VAAKGKREESTIRLRRTNQIQMTEMEEEIQNKEI
jgi:hypothetical protein